MDWRLRVRNGVTSRKWYCLAVLLLLQLLVWFAKGQVPPATDQQYFTVYEEQAAGTEIGQIRTQAGYTYTFSDVSQANYFFLLNSVTGKITTKVVIDRESLNVQDNTFHVIVLARSPTATHIVEISIEVLDVNDNYPVFPNALVTVTFQEDVLIGTRHSIPAARDLDSGSNSRIYYDTTAGKGPFKVVYNPRGDVLIIETTGYLDREKVSQYEFIVSAQDEGIPALSSTCTVRIIISDVNDNPPRFNTSQYNVAVNETEPVGTAVMTVKATDRDIGVNAQISYHILHQNMESQQFAVDEYTGIISTLTEPLSCTGGTCLLTVSAYDHGIPPLTGRMFVYISIVDTNNHDPEIRFVYMPDRNIKFSSVNEDAPNGQLVAGVIVTDQDSGVYGQTTANITSGNEMNHFRLVTFASGMFHISINGDGVLDRKRQDVYNLTIQAKDGGNPPRSATNSLIIHVKPSVKTQNIIG